jgi:hypothetical protein
LGIFDANRAETRHVIASLKDIYQFSPAIEDAVKSYL